MSLSLIAGPKATGPPSERSLVVTKYDIGHCIDTRDALPDTPLFGVFLSGAIAHWLPNSCFCATQLSLRMKIPGVPVVHVAGWAGSRRRARGREPRSNFLEPCEGARHHLVDMSTRLGLGCKHMDFIALRNI